MQLRIYVNPVKKVYTASVTILGVTGEEADAIGRFGPLEIEVGGSFDDGEGLTFDLPTKTLNLYGTRADKVEHKFDMGDDADAGERAVLYVDTIKARITAARDVIVALDKSYIKDEQETV
jgi:hypothetical protein